MITLRQLGVTAIAVGLMGLSYFATPVLTVDALACLGAGLVAYKAVEWYGGDPA